MDFLQRLSLIVKITTMIVLLLGIGFLILPLGVKAVGLKITPLKYEQILNRGEQKTGYVDVANPGDFTITVGTDVEAFRQINNQGDLEYFEDEALDAGIKVDVDEFELGPREAARIRFDIDTTQLPAGGIYGVLFFETRRLDPVARQSSLETSARVGTLLILQNGEGERMGEISDFDLPFWQFGNGLQGNVSYHNIETERSVGFDPDINLQVTPWGEEKALTTGLVLPGITREFSFDRPANYAGLLPVRVSDETSGESKTLWIFALSGVARIIAVFLVLSAAASLALQRYFKNH